jgi:hypothetical protein
MPSAAAVARAASRRAALLFFGMVFVLFPAHGTHAARPLTMRMQSAGQVAGPGDLGRRRHAPAWAAVAAAMSVRVLTRHHGNAVP